MNWKHLEKATELNEIIDRSSVSPQVIFKHSTRCSTSSMVKNRLDKKEAPEGIGFYYLDLIRHRDISNKIAEVFGVVHESPQVLVIDKGKCTYHESHSAIFMDEIEEAIRQN